MPHLLTPFGIWFILGLFLVLAEFIVPGFFICFFGIGAILTACCVWCLPHLPVWGQVLLFVIGSIFVLIVGRRCFKKTFCGKVVQGQGIDADDDGSVGSLATVVVKIEPGTDTGRVEFRGSEWKAQSERICQPGETVTIVARKNITLIVK